MNRPPSPLDRGSAGEVGGGATVAILRYTPASSFRDRLGTSWDRQKMTRGRAKQRGGPERLEFHAGATPSPQSRHATTPYFTTARSKVRSISCSSPLCSRHVETFELAFCACIHQSAVHRRHCGCHRVGGKMCLLSDPLWMVVIRNNDARSPI
jgi:hypothetical protein